MKETWKKEKAKELCRWHRKACIFQSSFKFREYRLTFRSYSSSYRGYMKVNFFFFRIKSEKKNLIGQIIGLFWCVEMMINKKKWQWMIKLRPKGRQRKIKRNCENFWNFFNQVKFIVKSSKDVVTRDIRKHSE